MRLKFKYQKKLSYLFDTHKINFLLSYLKKLSMKLCQLGMKKLIFILLKTLNYKFNLNLCKIIF